MKQSGKIAISSARNGLYFFPLKIDLELVLPFPASIKGADGELILATKKNFGGLLSWILIL